MRWTGISASFGIYCNFNLDTALEKERRAALYTRTLYMAIQGQYVTVRGRVPRCVVDTDGII